MREDGLKVVVLCWGGWGVGMVGGRGMLGVFVGGLLGRWLVSVMMIACMYVLLSCKVGCGLLMKASCMGSIGSKIV
jgi:hypothetical protein